MNIGMMVRRRIREAARALLKHAHERFGSGSPNEWPVVFAVSNCYPTRIVLYAAAFQGGWNVQFMKSLREALEASYSRMPKAVFYDHRAGDPVWHEYCSSFAREGVPFVFLGHKSDDETFMVVLASGGYQAWGDPLSSEEIVKAVDFAVEVAGPTRAPVLQV